MLADESTGSRHNYDNHTSYLASNGTYDFSFENSRFISLLRNNSRSIEDLLRALDNWRAEHNITVEKECSRSEYCSGEFRDLIISYNSIHGYISLLICLFGSFANILNVAVLTRHDLAAAPINRLLKWLAVADVFVMMEYVPFAIYRYLLFPDQHSRPFSWAVYMLFHMHFTQILHTASILLTLSLAVWRYIAIRWFINYSAIPGGDQFKKSTDHHSKQIIKIGPAVLWLMVYPSHSAVLCTDRRCSMAILISFLLPLILCIPSYFVFKIHKEFTFDGASGKAPMKVFLVDSDYDGSLYQINFWVHAVVIKLLPCVILTVISAWLIRALYLAKGRKKALKGYSACPADTVVNGNGNIFTRKPTKRSKAERRADRTTRMLVAVLLLFLITEFPQGILGLLSGILGRCFFKRCYDLFGELMDALALLNGAINFVLYCSMSRQFRTTFGQLMRNRCVPTPRASSHTELQTTYV